MKYSILAKYSMLILLTVFISLDARAIDVGYNVPDGYMRRHMDAAKTLYPISGGWSTKDGKYLTMRFRQDLGVCCVAIFLENNEWIYKVKAMIEKNKSGLDTKSHKKIIDVLSETFLTSSIYPQYRKFVANAKSNRDKKYQIEYKIDGANVVFVMDWELGANPDAVFVIIHRIPQGLTTLEAPPLN